MKDSNFEFISIDKMLQNRMSFGKPVMPILLNYFDDELFDIYAGCYNAAYKPLNHGDLFELNIALSILSLLKIESDKYEYKILYYVIKQLLF